MATYSVVKKDPPKKKKTRYSECKGPSCESPKGSMKKKKNRSPGKFSKSEGVIKRDVEEKITPPATYIKNVHGKGMTEREDVPKGEKAKTSGGARAKERSMKYGVETKTSEKSSPYESSVKGRKSYRIEKKKAKAKLGDEKVKPTSEISVTKQRGARPVKKVTFKKTEEGKLNKTKRRY